MRTVRSWLGDFVFGIRLAVGTGRSPWGRLALTAIGIGLGAAVLLFASSVQSIVQNTQERTNDRATNSVPTEMGSVTPKLLTYTGYADFEGTSLRSVLLDPQRADAPAPPGVSRIPGPGEAVVSPEVQRLVNEPGGERLRSRVDGRIVGVVGDAGLTSPTELIYYQGSDKLSVSTPNVEAVYQDFGESQWVAPIDAELRLILVLGVTALLVPVVVFVSSTSRFAESTRQRRLAALRLVGASGRQIRRIASGESLIGSGIGVLVGWGIYLIARAAVAGRAIPGVSLFASDIRPTWWCAVLVTVGIPIIAVATAIGAMRRTVIEPLGVVRELSARPRRIVWRCAPIILGVAGLLAISQLETAQNALVWPVLSIVLILIGVPLILSWVVERSVRWLGSGSISWQLAVRRLQLTSGTAARSVSAIAVVLTGVIALQTVLTSSAVDQERTRSSSLSAKESQRIQASGLIREDSESRVMAEELDAVPGVGNVNAYRTLELVSGEQYRTAVIMDCATLRGMVPVDRCHDGDAFSTTTAFDDAPPHGGTWYQNGPGVAQRVELPPLRPLALPASMSRTDDPVLTANQLVLTPSLAANVPAAAATLQHLVVNVGAASPAAIERVHDILDRHLLERAVSLKRSGSDEQGMVGGIRYGLLVGALITFALIGCGLFVTAAEQLQERRRPMAVLGAVGIRPVELARSLLLQNGLPMLAAITVSVVLGLVLGGLMVLVMGAQGMVVDVVGMIGLVGLAALSVLVVTALALPVVGRAMHPEWLRTE